jgi:large subunit ribosomal protein L2
VSGPEAPVKIGNAMPLMNVPVGTDVHSVELKEGRGAQIARSAGAYCTVMAREEESVHLRMPSGEIRLVPRGCYAVIGMVGNLDFENIVIGSAGRNRWLGWRPSVRGMAMNPVDHPNGGGEGRSKSGGGWQHPQSPWGVLSKGGKTRKKKKYSNRFIISRRVKK